MPRASRHFLPGHVWHITHRCHRKQFLLKFVRDRRRWVHWLYKARKRFDLCVLNYVVTSNHIHLLVRDRGRGEIARSMQLIAGRTAQEHNLRRRRQGAFWQDRYHATAVDTGAHLLRCMTYIDLNMVRAGVVSHPSQWEAGGYRQIQTPPPRYRIVDLEALMDLCGIHKLETLQATLAEWVTDALETNELRRESFWTESLAVGSHRFVDRIKEEVGIRLPSVTVRQRDGHCFLREAAEPYNAGFGGENGPVRAPEGSMGENSGIPSGG